jgi:hypothetical protein
MVAPNCVPSCPDPRIKSEGRLVPGIHVFQIGSVTDVDGRNECGHDVSRVT